MRILLDECVPRRLRQHLPGHEVRTMPEMGWASFKNGDLLGAASGLFDVLITTDQRFTSERSLANLMIAVVVLVARRNKLEFLLPQVPQLLKILAEIRPGEVRRTGA